MITIIPLIGPIFVIGIYIVESQITLHHSIIVDTAIRRLVLKDN